jgi:hypothetical protein
MIINSGGALGTDTYFEKKAEQYNFKCCAFSYKTYYHKSKHKVEISDTDYTEGISKVLNANEKILKRPINRNSKHINLLARNWAQVKYSDAIVAIGYLVDANGMGRKYKSKSKYQTIDGGTGYAVAMAMVEKKDIYIFDLQSNLWYDYDYAMERYLPFEPDEIPSITKYKSIAGIGTRELTTNGEKAIDLLFSQNFTITNNI